MNQSQQNFINNSNPNNGISICIPRVFKNIPHWRIKRHFIEANLGFVERVDVIHVPSKDGKGKGYKRAYVHFAPGKWNMRDQEARNVLTALQHKQEVKIMYEEPWFWKITISTSQRPDEAPKPVPRDMVIKLARKRVSQPKRKIDLDEPISARAMNVTPTSKIEEDTDYGKYDHLSEQAASFMMNEDANIEAAKTMASMEELKELSSV